MCLDLTLLNGYLLYVYIKNNSTAILLIIEGNFTPTRR